MRIRRVVAILLFLSCSGVPAIYAQTETGLVLGTVVDQQTAVIPGVKLRLISASTGVVREAASDSRGDFSFTSVAPGMYTLAVEHSGFKRFQKTNLNVEPNDHLSVGQIQLELGTASDEITVTAEGAAVQTASSERSGIITSQQVHDLTIINRDFAALASLLPGVVANTSSDAQGFRGSTTFNVNGGRTGQNNITIDGVPVDNSNTAGTNTFMSLDAISVVKIQDSAFQAEFGRKPGAAIQAVTKSGTTGYHGSLYWYQRNEAFNARGFFNKLNNLRDPPYRYTTGGANIGGPVYIPRLFEQTGEKKLFFFFSEERQHELRPQDIQRLTMPTLLERQGNFSQSFDSSGKLIAIIDPLTNKQFPGNIIPAQRINLAGQSYLNLFPAPNTAGNLLGKNFNFLMQESTVVPKHNEVLRLDYVLTPKTTIYGVMSNWSEEESGNAVPAGSTTWGWLPSTYNPVAKTLNISGTHIFTPTVIFESSLGASRWTEAAHPQQQFLDAKNRAKAGVNIPQFHPENNPLNLVPQATFGNIDNTPKTTYDGRFPIRGAENVFNWTGTVTDVRGAHTAKAGVLIEHWQELKGENGNFTGTFDFSSAGTFAGNTKDDFANALIGNFKTYTESTTRPPLIGRYNGVEWFLQDNWKATSRLTLDLGLRFGWSQPFHTNNLREAGFEPSLFNPAQQVQLYTAKNAPVPGAIGAIIPGSGDPLNGTADRVLNPGYPQGLRTNSGIKVAPRFGFAYDPFGKGSTAIRGGFGLFYDIRERDNLFANIFRNPPLQLNPTVSFQNIQNLLSSGTFSTPSDTTGFQKNRKLPYVMEFNLGIQQAIGFKTVLDIAYVGDLGRHLLWRRNLNAIPFGSVDPALPAVPSQFLRPYVGYGNILMSEYAGTSNYHSLQVGVNRRFTKSLQFGVAWTWSKAMDYADDETQEVSNLLDPKLRNYGEAGFDHTHVLKASLTWDVPNASRVWDNRFARTVLDSWTISGIPTLQSGVPLGITVTNGTTISGSPTDAARVVFLHSPILPKDQRTFSRFFDPTAFGLPQQGTPGNAPRFVFRGPGINNWDMALFKQIPMPGEHLKMQFRAEAYNALNHTQFSTVDNTARFDATGKQINPTFGQFLLARPNRRMQLALRLSF